MPSRSPAWQMSKQAGLTCVQEPCRNKIHINTQSSVGRERKRSSRLCRRCCCCRRRRRHPPHTETQRTTFSNSSSSQQHTPSMENTIRNSIDHIIFNMYKHEHILHIYIDIYIYNDQLSMFVCTRIRCAFVWSKLAGLAFVSKQKKCNSVTAAAT